MRVVVIGSTGQLSRCLQDEAEKRSDVDLVVVGGDQCDVTKKDAVWDLVESLNHVKAVINTAAFHDLKACEQDFDAAFRVNALAVSNLAEAWLQGGGLNCHFYTMSTDYVFGDVDRPTDGMRPFHAHEKPMTQCNNYGRTKRAAELICAQFDRATVIRTASLFSKYGSTGKGGSNFLLQMIERAEILRGGIAATLDHVGHGLRASDHIAMMSKPIEVVDDVVMSPTYTPWLARAILQMVSEGEPPPLCHLVCDGPPVSWFDFAKTIFEVGGFDEALERVVPVRCGDWPPRPRYSALENSSSHIRLGTWRDGLKHFFRHEYGEMK